MAWWHDWFDAHYLRFAVGLSNERTEREVSGIEGLLALPSGSQILDVACGHGRHAIPLAKRGYKTLGIDVLPWAIEQARRAASEIETAEFRVEDMRDLNAYEEFDGAIFINTTLGAFDDPSDDLTALRNVWNALRVGSPLVLDCRHRDIIVRKCPPKAEFWEIDGAIVMEKWTFDPVASIRRGQISWIEGNQLFKKTPTQSRYYTITQLKDLVTAAGFHVEGLYGGFFREDVSLDSNVVMLLRKS